MLCLAGVVAPVRRNDPAAWRQCTSVLMSNTVEFPSATQGGGRAKDGACAKGADTPCAMLQRMRGGKFVQSELRPRM
ncbi:hypothetical protein TRAPUB_13814 [Trametes pubescens]|uniref:Uncharacterized protein n=1 Tax=Trametes pubescens TaxID=154538 RepID=A0A1M2VQ35_TRAPU|nr:hypothetical protein TRAPUB_13814 [Trametes pubescens]